MFSSFKLYIEHTLIIDLLRMLYSITSQVQALSPRFGKISEVNLSEQLKAWSLQ